MLGNNKSEKNGKGKPLIRKSEDLIVLLIGVYDTRKIATEGLAISLGARSTFERDVVKRLRTISNCNKRNP